MTSRPRRLRHCAGVREMARETRLSEKSLVLPLFVKEGRGIKEPITSMEGQFRYSPDLLPAAVDVALEAGVTKFLLFGLPAQKDDRGSGAYADDGIAAQAIRAIRQRYGNKAYIITDVCMCAYTSHGHCGVFDGVNVDNDKSLPFLADIARSHAEAGADMVAPSDMMDGRVRAIRKKLDECGCCSVPIMSYSAKYASSFYGPFREAAVSAPGSGDRKAYQMDYHNLKEGLREARLDEEEGADILMVKPALAYLDVISRLAANTSLPVAAYSVSGEYAMIKAAARQGYVDEYGVMCESAVAVFRAGASILITYYAQDIAKAIKKGDIG